MVTRPQYSGMSLTVVEGAATQAHSLTVVFPISVVGETTGKRPTSSVALNTGSCSCGV